jgi:hypothetical protein
MGFAERLDELAAAVERAEMMDSAEAAYVVSVVEGQDLVRPADRPRTLGENPVGR